MRALCREVTEWALVLAFCVPATSQTLVDSARAADLLAGLSLSANDSIRCVVMPVAPQFTFSFRFQAGYVARVPLQQFHGPGHTISVLLRVASEAGDREPVYLLRRFDLPDVPETEFAADLAGAFLVGEGRYQSSVILFDDSHRVCRSAWRVEVKALPARQQVRLLIPPGNIAPLSAAGFSRREPLADEDAPARRTTIFLHAASMNPGEFQLEAGDVVMTIGSLAALLERLPPHSVRLVVFNLHRQEELYRNNAFTTKDLDRVTEVLDGLQLGKVDYRELQHPGEERALLRNLIQRELNEDPPSADLIFLGPDGSYAGGDPFASVAPGPERHFFYLQYRMANAWGSHAGLAPPRVGIEGPRPARPCQATTSGGCGDTAAMAAAVPVQPLRLPQPAWTPSDPDAIATVVRRLKGKVLAIHNALDFAKAVDRIELRE